ncbi:MAG: M67 family metallopeptidase [Anaerolineae bacterium]|nr:M67 family metallopeptidase [Anaerolineae bacterium]
MVVLKNITLRQEHLNLILKHAGDNFPLEVCGLIAGSRFSSTAVYPIPNILNSSTRFQMDPAKQVSAMFDMEKNGWDLLSIYHSHPHGPEKPSPTDVRECLYPEVVQIILSKKSNTWRCSGFIISDGNIGKVIISISHE